MNIRCAETVPGIDVDDMLYDIGELHMEPLELAPEVIMVNQYFNVEVELYSDGEPTTCPLLYSCRTASALNHRGPTNTPSSYIVRKSGTEMNNLGLGWLINTRSIIPSISIG